MGRLLGKPESWINDNLIARDARVGRTLDTSRELISDLRHNMPVSRLSIHLAGPSAIMHQHHRNSGRRHDVCEVCIIAQGRHVVDHRGSPIEHASRHLGLVGVD